MSKSWIKNSLWFLGGVVSVAVVSALYVSFHSGVGILNITELKFERPLSPSDRVRSVVNDWSGSSDYSEKDELKIIWDNTRKLGHDYPFDSGGSDNLAKMLNTEFKHAPKADFTMTRRNFPPDGNLKTFADLTTTYNRHVGSQ